MFIGFKLIFFIIFYIKLINKLFKLYIQSPLISNQPK